MVKDIFSLALHRRSLHPSGGNAQDAHHNTVIRHACVHLPAIKQSLPCPGQVAGLA
jgi:hypothetical protein